MQATNATLSAIVSLARSEHAANAAYDFAATDRDAELCALMAQIVFEPGKPASADAIEEYKAMQAAWTGEYAARIIAEQGVKPDSDAGKAAGLAAQQAWSRVTRRCGIVKPQSAEAIRKQEVRKAKNEADKVNPKGKPESPADGAKAAEEAQLKLSAIEVHLIMLMRKGAYTQAAQCIADLAKAK